LKAGYVLQKAGLEVTVFEGSERVGGRIHTSHTTFPGNVCEFGGEFIDTNHTDIWALVKELELSVIDIKGGKEAALERTFRFGNHRYSERDLANALQPVIRHIVREEESLELPFRSQFSQSALRRDHLSLEEYLAGLPMEGWLRALLNVVYTTEFGLDTGDQSSLNVLTLLRGKPDENVRFYGESDERFRLRDGNEQIVSRLSQRLHRPIELSHRLVRISESTHGFNLVFQTAGGTVEKQFDHVVMALPFTMLRSIDLQVRLHTAQLRAIRALGYGENSTAMLGVHRRGWRESHLSGESISDLGIQTTWDGSRGSGSPHGFLTCYLGGTRGRRIGEAETSHAMRLASKDLRRVSPELSNNLAGSGHVACWRKNPWSHGSYSCYKVGQFTTMRGFESLTTGGMFFAGEHCSLTNKAFMNGAAESGRIAAEAIVRMR